MSRSSKSIFDFNFPDTATADAFRNRFGGECLTATGDDPNSAFAAPRVATTPSAALFFTDAINGEMDGLSTLRSELGAKDSTE